MTNFDPLDLISPRGYGESGPPHALFSQLRKEFPVVWCEPQGYAPFWAITRHQDIVEISRNPKMYSNEKKLILSPLPEPKVKGMVRSIANMDPPDHRAYRKIAAGWFIPKNIARVESSVRQQAKQILDEIAERQNTNIDFVEEVATTLPLRMICGLLGIPVDDEPFVRRITDEIFASDDPDLKRPSSERGSAYGEVFRYFANIFSERRRCPREDLMSMIANGQVNGNQIAEIESFSYALIMVTAGHDTTKNALAGGINSLVSNQQQYQRLCKHPEFIPSAVEEILRFVSPVNHFMRTAIRDVKLGGKTIKEGDSLVLFYTSANRDESVFSAPDEFLVDRTPNPHLAFGIGEHFCIGAALARMEIRVLLEELTARVASMEFDGQARGVHSNFVNGLKDLPIKLNFRQSPVGQEKLQYSHV